jgi:hypothetical protein
MMPLRETPRILFKELAVPTESYRCIGVSENPPIPETRLETIRHDDPGLREAASALGIEIESRANRVEVRPITPPS